MRSLLLICVILLAGCDNVTFYEPQPQKISNTPFTREADLAYAGETVNIYDERGNIEVVGVPGLEYVRVTAWPSADASSDEEANAAFADVEEQFGFYRSEDQQNQPFINIACQHAASDHGGVSAFSTGCERLLVEVPTGSVDAPVTVSANAVFGSVRLRDVTGSVTVEASFAMIVSVTPVVDGRVSVISRPDGTNAQPLVAVALPADYCTKALRALAFGSNHQATTSFPWVSPDVCEYPYTATQPVYVGEGPIPCLTSNRTAGCEGIIEIANTHGDVAVLDKDWDTLPWNEIP